MKINELTGLRETTHDYYKVPLVYQKNINALRLNGQRKAVHTTPLANGLTLDFYCQISANDTLFVVFHGANSEDNNFYPRFERVKTFQPLVESFLNVADPTMQMDATKNMLIGWYLGGPTFDPIHPIFKVIRRAVGRTGAKKIAFIGGSGGGFAALRASAMWPGSLAFIQDPQTNIALYSPRIVKQYFESCWPGWSRPSLLSGFPERFDMVRHYQNFQPDNFVYYAQNSSDQTHVERHYGPFAEIHGMKDQIGLNSISNRYFALYDGENQGHGKITSEEFVVHFKEALQFWESGLKIRGF